MSNSIISLTNVISSIACFLVAGVFLSFSDFVMRSLDTSASPGRIEVMQKINREVFHSFFMVLLIGMSLISPALVITAWVSLEGVVSKLTIAGGAVYLVFVFCVTMLGNVPLNGRLDRLPTQSPEASNYWAIFYPRWNLFNHIRTIGAAVAGLCFLLACIASQ